MEDEVVRIAKKMDKMVQKKNAAGALDLLKELKNIPMTLELLQNGLYLPFYFLIDP
uniref:Transcription elongation factor A1 n=1 Tax=Microcebus murinus TaxID=30608 RepID=A0A8C6EGJ3_MICMU